MLAMTRAGALLCVALTGCTTGRAYSIAMVDPGGTETVIVANPPAIATSSGVANAGIAVLPGRSPVTRTSIATTLITRTGATATMLPGIPGVSLAAAPPRVGGLAARPVGIVGGVVASAAPIAAKPVHAGIAVAALGAKPVVKPILASTVKPIATQLASAAAMKPALGGIDTSMSLAAPTPGLAKPAIAGVTKLAKGHGKPRG